MARGEPRKRQGCMEPVRRIEALPNGGKIGIAGPHGVVVRTSAPFSLL